MSFDLKIKHDGQLIQKAKVQELDDFDPILDGLKEKFGSNKKGRRQ
jgi:hypothetical protein